MPELHLIYVLFGTNFVSNISTKASKEAPYLMPNFMEIRCRFNAYFTWETYTQVRVRYIAER